MLCLYLMVNFGEVYGQSSRCFISLCSFGFQSVKILTYREPQNREYRQFVQNLKADAERSFNFNIKDSLVRMMSSSCDMRYLLEGRPEPAPLEQYHVGGGSISFTGPAAGVEAPSRSSGVPYANPPGSYRPSNTMPLGCLRLAVLSHVGIKYIYIFS